MAGRKGARGAEDADLDRGTVLMIEQLTRIAKAISFAAVKGEPEEAQAVFLSGIGFTSPEIAAIMGKKDNQVRAMLSHARTRRKAKGKGKRAEPS